MDAKTSPPLKKKKKKQNNQCRTPAPTYSDDTLLQLRLKTSKLTSIMPDIDDIEQLIQEYDPPITSTITSPMTMSSTIVPSIPYDFPNGFDQECIARSIVTDSLMYTERKHLILHSNCEDLSFGSNIHPDRQ